MVNRKPPCPGWLMDRQVLNRIAFNIWEGWFWLQDCRCHASMRTSIDRLFYKISRLPRAHLHENRRIYPNRIPNKPPSSVASVKRVGMMYCCKSKSFGNSAGSASSFMVTMYWNPRWSANFAPSCNAFATCRSSTPSKRWLSWKRKHESSPRIAARWDFHWSRGCRHLHRGHWKSPRKGDPWLGTCLSYVIKGLLPMCLTYERVSLCYDLTSSAKLRTYR